MAQELARLDNFGIEKINTPDPLVNLYVNENCSVCLQQTDVIKECVSERVGAFILQTAIYQGPGGILRKSNLLAKGGLIAAAMEKESVVSAEHIRIASTELL